MTTVPAPSPSNPETPSIPETLRELRATFDANVTKPLRWRLEQLDALERMLREREHEFADALEVDLGKSPIESFMTETSVTISEVAHLRRNLRRWLKPKHVRPNLAVAPAVTYTVREPLGAALIIAPWNYPLQLALAPLAGAFAAGNVAVVKPSEHAPATSAALAKHIAEYLDPRAVRVVEGAVAASTELLAQRWDTIFYTGGAKVARIVARAAAEHLTPVTLELGGKSPVFVDDTADFDVAARRIAWGKLLNAGQTCVAPDYVLATPRAACELAERIPAAVKEMLGERPKESGDYARIIHDAHFERLESLLEGGRIHSGGSRDASTRFFEPTVLVDVDESAPIMQEEIFGPILPLIQVNDENAAITFINSREKPLALYLFSERKSVRQKFLRHTSSGALAVGLTVAHVSVPELPFGGVGESGIGAYHGEASLDAFSHRRAVLRKPSFPDTLRLVYPPFGRTGARREIIRRVLGN